MRSESKLSGYRPQYGRNIEPQHSYISNRSNTSGVHSEHLKKMIEEVEMYPSGFAQLLKFQERNIKNFKTQINKQKDRINDDMGAFKMELTHTLDDLRLSLNAYLDRIYQSYIERYAKFKGQILQINRLKDQLEIQCGGSLGVYTKSSHFSREPAGSTLSSNNQTISQMQNGNKELKKYHYLNYIAELQKQRILPLTDLQRQIVILNQYSNGFYQPNQFQQILSTLKGYLNAEVHRVYDNSHLFIRQVDSILFKEQPKILDQVYQRPPVSANQPFIPQPPVHQVQYTSIPPTSNIPYNNVQMPPSIRQSNAERQPPSFYNPPPKNITQSNARLSNRSERAYTPEQSQAGSPLYGQVAVSQQSVRVDWVQRVNLVHQNRFQVSGSQVALCGINVNNQYMAFGMKDGTIQIFNNERQPVTVLKEHKSSICSLSIIKIKGQTYLASGSDIGCSKIITWNIATWQPLERFENHKAAVTAIIDLQDNTHILSGSYDKKINVYNVEQGRFVYNLPANQTSVTGAIINKNATRVITCGLDKALNVWQISKTNGKVDTLFLQRKIQNDVLICSMVASASQNQLVVIGTKDGKIKMINVEKGQSYKTIACSENYLIEMILVERDSKPYYPLIIAWPYKQNKLFIVNSESSSVSTKTTNTFLQFGCGVSPKCFFMHKGGVVCCVSHNQQAKQVTQFRIQELK